MKRRSTGLLTALTRMVAPTLLLREFLQCLARDVLVFTLCTCVSTERSGASRIQKIVEACLSVVDDGNTRHNHWFWGEWWGYHNATVYLTSNPLRSTQCRNEYDGDIVHMCNTRVVYEGSDAASELEAGEL